MEAFEQLIKQIAPNLYAYRDRFFTSFQATFEMFAKAGILAFVIGMFFGVLLVITRKGGVRENIIVYQIANILINVFRSIPFIILVALLINSLIPRDRLPQWLFFWRRSKPETEEAAQAETHPAP